LRTGGVAVQTFGGPLLSHGAEMWFEATGAKDVLKAVLTCKNCDKKINIQIDIESLKRVIFLKLKTSHEI